MSTAPSNPSSPTAVLLIACPDRRGIVAATAEFISGHNGNIIHTEQHTDSVEGAYFQRVEFELDGLDLGRDEIADAFAPVAHRFSMSTSLHFTDTPAKVAVLASRQPHCLHDLMSRHRSGDFDADVVAVISNHPDHADFCQYLGVEYLHLPVTPETKADQETQLLAALAERGVELVVMARYMQILSSRVIDAYPHRIINIHHSFLPAFVGANPYRQAYDRGVKLIGATAHYATEDLDEGPIISQETAHVSHRDDAADLTRKGRDLETVVLARAVRAHLEHRVLVYGRKTVVFEG